MGEHDNRRDQGIGGKIQPVNDGSTGSSGSSSSSTSSEGSGTGTRTGTGTTKPTGTGTRTGTTENQPTKEAGELALLTKEELEIYNQSDEKEKKRILNNAKRRKRYAEQKGETQAKPRKVNKKKNETKTTDLTQLNGLIVGLSGIIASRPNCSHWLLSEAEVNSITIPLSKMLEESGLLSEVSEHSNQIALVMACITVFVPRMIMSITIKKEVKKIAKSESNNGEPVGTIRKEKNSDPKTDRRNDRNPSGNGTGNGQNVPWYGDPIC